MKTGFRATTRLKTLWKWSFTIFGKRVNLSITKRVTAKFLRDWKPTDEIGQLYGVRFIQSRNIKKESNARRTRS